MEVHIGNEIRRVLEEKGTKASWLAERINTSDRNIYAILNRAEISTKQLYEISKALEYNFFELFDEDEIVQASESLPVYGAKRKLSVSIELDGSPETLKQWFNTLEKINAAI